MTQLSRARNNEITKEMEIIAKDENIDHEALRKLIALGRIIILNHINPVGIGYKLRTKINANIGTSPIKAKLGYELKKLRIAIKHGADTVMDLSTGGNIDKIRKEIIERSSIPVGTVPIYQAAISKDDILYCDEKDFLNMIKKHIEDGVDFITVHCGVTKKAIPLVKKRLTGVVSRGGSMLIKWMQHNKKENPLYENFDKILALAKKHDIVLSLGDGLRPGSIKDATDKAQIHELKILGELTKKAWQQDVQVMIEGPGHIPLNEIEKNVKLQKKYCYNAPFYVLGPLVTDIAPGYDHITAAIGGALAGMYGADYLCYVTPSEHLSLPNLNDVKEGVIVTKIAAHAADITKGINKGWDNKMSEARANLDWKSMYKLAINPERAKKIRESCKVNDPEVCSMCGKFCSMKIGKELK